MKNWLCGAGVIGMLLAGPATAQYIATWQDPAGVWKGPATNQPGTDLNFAEGAAHRACLDRGIPKLWNRAAKVTEKATGKVVLELDCNVERTKTKERQAATSPPLDTTMYQAYWQEQSGQWKAAVTAPRHPGLLLASAKGYAHEACKDRGNPKDLKLASKVTEKDTGKVVLELDCNVERAKLKADSNAAKPGRDSASAKQ